MIHWPFDVKNIIRKELFLIDLCRLRQVNKEWNLFITWEMIEVWRKDYFYFETSAYVSNFRELNLEMKRQNNNMHKSDTIINFQKDFRNNQKDLLDYYYKEEKWIDKKTGDIKNLSNFHINEKFVPENFIGIGNYLLNLNEFKLYKDQEKPIRIYSYGNTIMYKVMQYTRKIWDKSRHISKFFIYHDKAGILEYLHPNDYRFFEFGIWRIYGNRIEPISFIKDNYLNDLFQLKYQEGFLHYDENVLITFFMDEEFITIFINSKMEYKKIYTNNIQPKLIWNFNHFVIFTNQKSINRGGPWLEEKIICVDITSGNIFSK